MKHFVKKEFTQLLMDKNKVVDNLPKYMAIIQPLVQLSAYLYYLQRDKHVHLIHKIHALFCDKTNDVNFRQGIHKLVLSILAAMMTQSDQVLRMYPVLTGLGKRFLSGRCGNRNSTCVILN